MKQYLEEIDNYIAEKHLLKHPFYLAWTRGELSKEALTDYAQQVLSSRRSVSDVSIGGACALRSSGHAETIAQQLDR